MRAILFGILAIQMLIGCALKVETSGHSSGEVIYWGESVGYTQINPELNSHIPEIAKTLINKGLILNTKSPYASLQLTIDLKSTGQGLSTTVESLPL